MNDEIKEILDDIKDILSNKEVYDVEIDKEVLSLLLDYITNLQQQLHQASLDIQELTEKDIGCPSWCDKLTNLQQEINKLTAESTEWESKCYEMQDNFHNANEEIERLNTCIDDQERVINSLIDKRDLYKINYADYKSRCEKAIEYINKEFKDEPYSVFIYGKTNIDNLLNILQNGSDDNE